MSREELSRLWARIDSFCIDRGWVAELYVREDAGRNFGRVGARVDQGLGFAFQAFGDTAAHAIGGLVPMLEREGFGV